MCFFEGSIKVCPIMNMSFRKLRTSTVFCVNLASVCTPYFEHWNAVIRKTLLDDKPKPQLTFKIFFMNFSLPGMVLLSFPLFPVSLWVITQIIFESKKITSFLYKSVPFLNPYKPLPICWFLLSSINLYHQNHYKFTTKWIIVDSSLI